MNRWRPFRVVREAEDRLLFGDYTLNDQINRIRIRQLSVSPSEGRVIAHPDDADRFGYASGGDEIVSWIYDGLGDDVTLAQFACQHQNCLGLTTHHIRTTTTYESTYSGPDPVHGAMSFICGR